MCSHAGVAQASLSAIRFPFSVLRYEFPASARKMRENAGTGVRAEEDQKESDQWRVTS